MATVRITERMREEVDNAIIKLYETRVTNASKKAINELTELGNAVYQKYMQKYADHLKALPKEFVRMDVSPELRVFQDGSCEEKPLSHKLPTSFDKPVFAPTKDGWRANVAEVRDHAAYLKTEQIITTRDAITDERDSLRDQVKDVMERCNTLKQLLEAWPQAENLIPSKYIERMHKKTHRTKPEGFVPPDVGQELSAKLLSAKIQASVA